MAYFLQSGDAFTPAPSREALLEALPAGNYTVEESLSGLYFKRAEPFQASPRLYGELGRTADRIMQTFQDRSVNTGVLLAGEKGSGKSLLGRIISSRAADLSMPTILLNQAWPGDRLGPLLSHLSSPAVIFFDEFEKIYSNSQAQESVLSLLDGTQASRHLFVLTVNDMYRVDSHLKNRPGRLYYSLSFSGLEADFIREYCSDRLEDKDQAEAVVRLASLFDAFNFDMLKALVEEMNRYGEAPREAVKLLNITPAENHGNYSVELRDSEGQVRELDNDYWYGNPLFLEEFEPDFTEDQEDSEEAKERNDAPLAQWEQELLRGPRTASPDALVFTADDLATFDASAGTYVFQCEGWTLTLRARQPTRPSRHWAAGF